jgi:WD40 repeat protein
VVLNPGTKSVRPVVESHSDGEVWGLAVGPNNLVATCGDDNRIRVWDVYRRQCIHAAPIEYTAGDPNPPGVGASTLATTAPNQQARAIAISPANGAVVIGCNDGHFSVRRGLTSISEVVHTGHGPSEWIEVMKFSPNGRWLAIGSHDN